MSIRFPTCFYLFLIIINNIFILLDGAAVPNNGDPLLQKEGTDVGRDSQVKAQGLPGTSELFAKIKNSGLLSSRYETNYFMEITIKFLVRYLSLITNFSAIFGDRSYGSIHKKISDIASYLESRSSYCSGRKMLFQFKIDELSQYINEVTDIKLFSSLFTDSNQISKEVIFNIAGNSKILVDAVVKIVKILRELSSLEVDSNLKHISEFLGKLSDDCLRMFNNCIRKYSRMSKSQFESLLASKMGKIFESTLLVKLNNELDDLTHMKTNFEKIFQQIQAYNQFLETGEPHFTSAEIKEVKTIIENFFENGGLDETFIFKNEEIVLISLEFLGLAAMNLSLFDKTGYFILKNEVEEAWKSTISMINYRGTEIRLSQNVVFAIREQIRTLMRYQEFLKLDFTIMNLDKSLIKSELLHIVSRFYESLLKTFEFVKREQSRNNGGRYLKTIFSKLDPIFEKALDFYKDTILSLEQIENKSKKTSGTAISRGSKRSMDRVLTKKIISTKKNSKVKDSSKKIKRMTFRAKEKKLNKLEHIKTGKKRKGVSNIKIKKKTERKMRARILSEIPQLLSVSRTMKSQLYYLNRTNRIEIAAIVESVLEVLAEILFSEGLSHRENILGGEDSSVIVRALRSIGDQINFETLPNSGNFNGKTQTLRQCQTQNSAVKSGEKQKLGLENEVSLNPSKSLNSNKNKRKACETVRPLKQIGPTIKLFGEKPVFATQGSKTKKSDVTNTKASNQKSIFKTHSKHFGRKTKPKKNIDTKTSSVNNIKAKKTVSSSNSDKPHINTSKKLMTNRMPQNQNDSTVYSNSIENRSLLMTPPTFFDRETILNMVSMYNIKFLNFSHISIRSSSDCILQAVNFCYNEIGHLFFEIFPFITGIEKIILEQIIIQMIVLFKNLVSILIAKDRKKSKSFRRDIR
ncbi:uncharacterized protein cubi_00012 [Cryptosporidium ubiquitum]|uniref:Uncharacterized protein n=1 Tax=Cryptosporidium ubiquitum TaxID=857276 RepID=A0A1J4MLX4_9CRYT|nr:uncharacterized protein cubi_00012 [Cryptosporidium ubiquitum]OII74459.1 hypothetical protein cubi_00012 [Cryptosporidium ubiquitum]